MTEDTRKRKETVRYWRCDDLPGVELLRADYASQSYSWHTHETFAFGAIERGALAMRLHGMDGVAPAGNVAIVFPGEAHTGHGADSSGWSYRMFYIDPAILADAASGIAPGRLGLPPLPQGAISDPDLSESIGALHRMLEQGAGAPLERQERLLAILARFIRRHALWDAPPPERVSRATMERVRIYLDERVSEDVTLPELAAAAGCNPFRLVRAFRSAYGLPPHAYQLQRRVRRAQELLRAGWNATTTAAELGFVDQSHFSRIFRQITGMTPGAFARCVRADAPKPRSGVSIG